MSVIRSRAILQDKFEQALANDGFRETTEIIDDARSSGVCLSICANVGCYNTARDFSHQQRGYCSRCGTQTMISIVALFEMLAGGVDER